MGVAVYRAVESREKGKWKVVGPAEHEEGGLVEIGLSRAAAYMLATDLEKAYWVGKLHGVQEAEERAIRTAREGM